MNKSIYIIGIGGIGVSAIARYYLHLGWKVYGNDIVLSELTKSLKNEGVNISPLAPIITENNNKLDLLVYTEAVPNDNEELLLAKNSGIKTITYPEALAEIVNKKKLITIAGTHGKSTTTSLISLVLKDSKVGINSVVGTILKEFGNKNTYFSDSELFVIEACEYKRSFLKYKPSVGVITNIELDHADYYKDLEDYISAYREYLDNIISGGFAILNGEDKNCKKLLGLRSDINYIEIYNDYFKFNSDIFEYPEIIIPIPGKHILYDAKIAYVIAHMLGIDDIHILNTLEEYSGVWRRMETIGKTLSGNILMSDYGHHPTEIKLTLDAIKTANPDKQLFTIFQPHQYNRTLELLKDFKNCFSKTDKLIIPDIYESRDTNSDKQKINSKRLIEYINHPDKRDGEGLNNTLKLILDYDKKNPNSSIILLLGAGNIDDLRYKIKTS